MDDFLRDKPGKRLPLLEIKQEGTNEIQIK